MDSGTEGSEPRCSSVRHPTDRPPCHQNSFTESGPDVEEKALEGKEETLLSPLRESRTQRRGPEPKTEEEDPRESEPKRDSCISGSESEGCSSWEGSGKRKVTSSDSTCPPAAGASPAGERSVTPGKRKRTTPDSGQGSESEETAGARRRRRGARGAGRGRRSRRRSPGDRPPPLRKRLVTAVRALSEAVRQDVAGAWEQRERSPLTWEQRSGLGRLWAPLGAALQTVYTMANQAAYVFPAESWLVPAPPPGPRAPAGDTGEARGSPRDGHGASPPRVGSEAARAPSGTRAAAELRAQPPGRDQGPATAHTAGTARVRLGALGAKALPTPSAELTSSRPISC
ncbi:protein FRG2-like-1 [Panthera pardus]|uniref:Protein FRG2-like-1 n=1 Tax=Panthera pardus TaxID=9691 RepID=A0A9W2VUG8_PANPR|nr:protein FRG2-like-1 [Panthera pardus]